MALSEAEFFEAMQDTYTHFESNGIVAKSMVLLINVLERTAEMKVTPVANGNFLCEIPEFDAVFAIRQDALRHLLEDAR